MKFHSIFLLNFFIDLTCTGLMAREYIDDITMPVLRSFNIDMNTGILNLTFDETINITTFSTTELTLVNARGDIFSSYTIRNQGFIFTDDDSPIVSLLLNEDDLNAIKYDTFIFTTSGNSFITLTNNTVIDMSGNLAMIRDASLALRVSDYIEDTEPPNLTGFELNLDSNTIALTFDESVSTTFNPSVITLLNNDGGNYTRIYTLQGVRATEVYSDLGRIVRVNLTITDQMELKAYEDFATSTDNTFLSITNDLTTDRNSIGNPNNPINITSPLRATNIISDQVSPRLEQFLVFDLNEGTFRVRFDEPVNISSIVYDRITIIPSERDSAINRTLVAGEAVYLDSLRTVVEIRLSAEDLASIKLNDNLATSRDTTYIQLERGAILDQGGNDVLPLSPLITDFFLFDRTGPRPVSFTLDMNLGIIVITFNDVVRNEQDGNTNPIDISGIAIQIDSSGAIDRRVSFTQQPDRDAITNSSNGYETLIFIPLVDLNRLKELDDLATSVNNTYLTLTAETIEDIDGNEADPIVSMNALRASHFVPDTSSPILRAFNLDLDGEGLLELSFSETLIQEFLDVTQITLVGDNSETVTLSSTRFQKQPPLPSFTITLNSGNYRDLDVIKSFPNLASFRSNTFLAITSAAVNDTNENPVIEISQNMPQLVSMYTPDTTRPELMRFELDLNRGALIFTFTETVNGSSFDPREIVITNDGVLPSLQYRLTGGDWNQVFNRTLHLNLSITDLNRLKQIINLADNQATTFIFLTSQTVRDMESNSMSNEIVEIQISEGMMAGDFIFDTTSPQLSSFSLNLSSEILILTFDETVNASSLLISQITIQSEILVLNDGSDMIESGSGSGSGSGNGFNVSGSGMNLLIPESVFMFTTLTSSHENSSFSTSQDSTVIVINLGPDDLNSLKLQTGLATEASNTFISFSNTTIADMNGNLVENISQTQAEQVDSFYPDLVSPILVRFDLNLTSELISLTFSEVVNASSINVTLFTLIAGPNLTDVSRTLTEGVNGSYTSNTDGTEITIYLGSNDLNEIKRLLDLGTSVTDSYLSFSSYAIRDMNGNRVIPRTSTNPIRVSLYTEDGIRPTLAAFNLDINRGLLSLEFSETVNAASLNVSGITLHSAPYGEANESFSFTSSSTTSSNDGTGILVNISRNNLNNIKFLTDLAQNFESSYLAIENGAIRDINFNPIVAIPDYDSLPVSTYIFDTVGPILESFELDLNTGVLILHFDETVDISSLLYTLVTIQSSLQLPTAEYNLSTGIVLHDNSPDVETQIDFHDLNQIKLDTNLATNFNNTFLTVEADAIIDLSLDENPSFAAELALAEVNFTPDQTRPMLLDFSVNLNSETLTLNFDEPVNAMTLDATGITLLNRQGGTQYELTGGNTSSINGLQIVVDLIDRDLDIIKEMESLLVSTKSNFISITEAVIADMNGNQVNPIPIQDALNSSSFINDTTRPNLREFDLNLNSNILTLEFVETVNTSSINFTGIVLQQASNSTNQYRLTDGVLLSLADSTIVRFELVTEDLNAIKSQRIALSSNTTWLILDDFTILDQNMQPVIPLENGINARPVRIYIPDMVPPVLLSYILDLNTDTLTLQFSETVNVLDTLDITRFTLLSEPVVPLSLTQPRTHTFGLDISNTRSTDIYEPVVTVNLGRLDLNSIKEDIELATSINNTFLSIFSMAVRDMRFNPVVEILSLNPLAVTRYIQDMTSPQLENFDLNMNTGLLVLYFSESVNPTTLDISQFTLQYAEEGIPQDYSLSFTGGRTTAAPTPVITLNLLTPDLNEIKRIFQLATSSRDTYISVTEGGIQDMNGNFIERISNDFALPVNEYTDDITQPNLVGFDLNLSTERLILTFDETVNASSWFESGVTIQSSFVGIPPNVRVLFGGTVLTSDSTVVMVQLDASDLNYIKSIPNLVTSNSNTYLRLDSSTISDMAGNAVSELIDGRAIQVMNFTPDDQDPILISFNLDLNTGRLQLTFNETVNTSSLTVEYISLVSELSSTEEFSFNSSSNTASRSPDWPVILIQIGDDDLNEIKRRRYLATNVNNTYLWLNSLAINDTNQNPVEPVILPVTNFTEDITRPILSSFVFDLDEGLIHLTFSETVQYQTLNLTEITIQNQLSESVTSTYINLSGGDVITQVDSVFMSVRLNKYDLDTIKSIRTLAMSQSSTFLSLTDMAVLDMNENALVEIGREAAQMASEFIPDTTNPVLQRFELDMNTGILTMTFSETVDTTTLLFTELILQDSVIANSTYQFQTSVWSLALEPIVYIIFSKSDLDLLKENRQVGTDVNDTYISLTNETILDTSGNGVVPILNGQAQQVQRYVRDSTPPELERFNLDVDSGLLTLFYSETIDILSLDPTKIMLQNDVYNSSSVLLLTGGIIDPIDSTVGYIQFTISDLNELKRLVSLGTCTKEDTFLSLVSNSTFSAENESRNITQNTTDDVSNPSGFGSGSASGIGMDFAMLNLEFSSHVFDMAGNPVISIHEEMALRVETSQCTADTTRPLLTNFTLNMHNSTLILTFDETVNTSSLDLQEITFHNGQVNETQSYQLQSGYANNENLAGQVEIEVTISNTDLNELKRREYLATSSINTFISITQYLILDMNKNQNVEITTDNSTEAAVFIPDVRAPILLSFELDLTLERLTLSFSETVNASSLAVEGITLVNSNLTSDRNLMGGYLLGPTEGGPILGPNDPVLVVQLDQMDLNYIKSITDLATGLEETFISIENTTVLDMNDNAVEEISEFTPLQVSRFIEDIIDPYLVAFALDMNTGELFLTFSETVNVSSLDVSEITLQADVASPFFDQLRFTPGNTTFDTSSVSPDWPVITVDIGITDLNEIKRLTQLATSNITTFITLSNLAINDMSGNSIVPIRNGNGIRVSMFTPDTTNPNLVSFSLDLNLGLLQLTFDETVNYDSLNFSSITIQNSSDVTDSRVQFSDGETSNDNDSTVVEVIIAFVDLNEIKRIRSLGTSLDNTYISLLDGGILDMNNNPLNSVNDTDAELASVFTEDTTDPELVEFDLDMNNGLIYLTFDETVEADSVDLVQITLQDSAPASFENNTHILTGGVSSSEDSTVIVVTFSFFDLNEIKKIRELASDVNGTNSYISITNSTVVDMNGNPVQNLPDDSAIPVTVFTEDSTPPVLHSFNLDLNIGILYLNFSETVDTLTFDITQYTIQSARNISDYFARNYTLTEQNLLTGDEVEIIQNLLYFDLNTIKSIGGLATSDEDTYLSITDFAIQDMNGNLVVPIFQFEALPVSEYQRDINRPLPLSFDLDLNNGELTMTFSETVNVSTLDVSQITLLNDEFNVTQRFTLMSNSISMSPDWPYFVINIGDIDLNAIKRLLLLAVSNETTFIQLTEDTIRDTAGNMNLQANSTRVNSFIPDTTNPTLVSFDLDLTRDILLLSFSETVSGRTLMATQLTIISGTGNPSISQSGSGQSGSGQSGSGLYGGDLDFFTNYTLTGGENLPLSIDDTDLVIELTFADRNELKRLTDLATSSNNTFISITSEFIEDTNMNNIVPIFFEEALQVVTFSEDLAPPQLLDFDLNMDTRELTLYFSETVNVESLNVTQIMLQGSNELINGVTQYYTLTDRPEPLGSYSTSSNDSIIVIRIGEADANMIKFRTELAVNDNSTYISITSHTIEDMNRNPLVAVSDQNATRVRLYSRDATSPVLRAFHLNLTSERLTLSFDETVDFGTIQASLITLQNSFSSNMTSYRFRAIRPIGDNSPILVFNLTATPRDLNEIKFLSDLGTNINDTYITLSSGSVRDMSIHPNPIFTVTRAVDEYFPDVIPPEVVSFSVNINASTLTLIFDEVVNASSLNPTAIRVQNSSSLTASYVDLTGKCVYSILIIITWTSIVHPSLY